MVAHDEITHLDPTTPPEFSTKTVTQELDRPMHSLTCPGPPDTGMWQFCKNAVQSIPDGPDVSP